MKTEHEIKILDIDPHQVKNKIIQSGGKHIANLYFRRFIFEVVGGSQSEWLRLRTDGLKTTLTYKNAIKDAIDGLKEIEVEVNDFEDTLELLKRAGLKPVSYQENKRQLYQRGDIELAIDEWPLIPKYLEIEAPDKRSVEKMIMMLSLNDMEKTSLPTEAVYKKYGIDLKKHNPLMFPN